MVTAELALTFPALLLVLVTCLAALSWGVDQVRCVDAARVAVRELARGETRPRAVADASRAAPRGADIEVAASGGDVVVRIAAPAPTGAGLVTGRTQCSALAKVEALDATP